MGSLFHYAMVLFSAYFIWKAPAAKKEFRWIFLGSLGVWFTFFLLSCLPLEEIALRYYGWVLFAVILCFIEALRRASQTKKIISGVALGGLLLWQAFSVTWYLKNYKSIEFPWEEFAYQILSKKEDIVSVCTNPDFNFDYMKYSLAKPYWAEWDALRSKDCDRGADRKYILVIQYKTPDANGSVVQEFSLEEGMSDQLKMKVPRK
jgi:hypothetical protein